jgi:dUTP pyrophosphatase
MIDKVDVMIAYLDERAWTPLYAHEDDAGMDLHALERGGLGAGSVAVVGTGISIAIPEGYVGLVHPRSGLAAKYGITVLNAPGTIDSGYRGELKVILYNANGKYYSWEAGDRIAQLVIQRYTKANLITVSEIPETLRGEMGLGSTGL